MTDKPRRSLVRKSPLRSSSRLARTPLRKVNAERMKKRRAAYAKKLAKSRKSDGYREAMERAEGQCEYRYNVGHGVDEWRCPVTINLHAHHKTYARFGGDELASDYLICCEVHHDLIESQHSHRRHGRAA